MTCQSLHSSNVRYPIPEVSSIAARTGNHVPDRAKIISKIPMRDFLEKKGHIAHFTSSVFFVEREGGTRGVLKVVDTEKTGEVIAEVAAFRAARFLGLDFVPPTVLYLENGQIGSLQDYVEPLFDLKTKSTYQEVGNLVSVEEWANIQIFYFVFGQWDPDPSNMIVAKHEEKDRLFLIDNAAMGYLQKVKYGEYPFVLFFEDIVPVDSEELVFPFEKVQILPPDKEVWRERFGTLLYKEQIRRLCRLQKEIPFVFWKGHLWRQFRFGTPASTQIYPQNTMKALEELTLQNLKGFFDNELGFQFSDEYFSDILERRDQILRAYYCSKI